jgi:uncharacterized membrane protein (UPF0136 family)
VVREAPSRSRRTAFRIIATVMGVSGAAFGAYTAIFGIVSEDQRIHAFHNAIVATLLLVLSALPALLAARDPDRSTVPLVQLTVVGIAGLGTMILALEIDPFTLPFIALVGVLWILRPSRDPVIPRGRASPVLLALVVGAAVPLIAYALGQAEVQRLDETSEHSQFYHWVETSFYAAAIPLVGLLAALRPVAYRLSARSSGFALAVLGAASLALPGYASALENPWAWSALAGGIAYVGVAEWEYRRLSSASQVRD